MRKLDTHGLPGTDDQIIWNDRLSDAAHAPLVARILDVHTREGWTLPHPIYAIAPDGKTALSLNFARLGRARSGYGYPGVVDLEVEAEPDRRAPADDGIFAIDMRTGSRDVIVSLAEAVEFERGGLAAPGEEHFFDMVQVNPSGTRIVFFERWFSGGMRTRVFTVDLDGNDLYLLSAEPGHLSHVDWLDDRRLLLYASVHRGFAVYEDRVGYDSTLLESSRDGHQSLLPGNEWLVTDTYADSERLQHLSLFHLPSRSLVSLAHLWAPPGHSGHERCDNHPRVSRDGRKIFIDSAHHRGRQMYMLDIGPIVDTARR